MLTGTSPDRVPDAGKNILIVDDEPSLAKTYKLILESLGYGAEAKVHPNEALELFRADPLRFDLVITDMSMPSMSGKELAVRLIGIRPGIPVILCTGFCSREDKIIAEALGIRAVLAKPIFKADLAATLQEVFETSVR